MAINSDDSFVPSTKEYLVIQKYFSRLHHVIDDPVTLAIGLFSAGLISDWAMMKASCETSCVVVRNYHLLNGMKGAIVCDPNNLIKIISVLEDHPPLDSIAQEMKTDYESPDFSYEPSVTPTTSTIDKQSHKTVTVDESVHKDLSIMQGKLGALVLDVLDVADSAKINTDKIKQFLILSYPFKEFKEEIRRAQDLTDVFVAVRKLCSPVNLTILVAIVDRFKLSGALKKIEDYEVEEQIYRKKLMSAAFAQELQEEIKLTGYTPTVKCTITLHLNWSSPENFTIKEFEKIVKDVFSDLSQYIHIIKVEAGSIIVIMCAPESVIGALSAIAKSSLLYLLDIGVIFLQVGDEIILDKKDKQEPQYPNLNIIDTPGNGNILTQYVPGDDSYENPNQPIPVYYSSIISTISQTTQQQQNQLSKDVTDKQRGDEEVRALAEEIEELRDQLEIHVQQIISEQLTMELESIVQQGEATKELLPMTAKQQHEIEEIVSSLTLQLSKRERDNIQQSLKGLALLLKATEQDTSSHGLKGTQTISSKEIESTSSINKHTDSNFIDSFERPIVNTAENSAEREIHTERYQEQPLPVDNSFVISTTSQTTKQRQSQQSTLEKNVTDKQRSDEEVQALVVEIEELKYQLAIQQNISREKTMKIDSIEEKRKKMERDVQNLTSLLEEKEAKEKEQQQKILKLQENVKSLTLQLNIVGAPSNISLSQYIYEDENTEEHTEREVHTEVYQEQSLPVDNSFIISTTSQTATQQESQLSKLEKEKTDKQRRDEEVRSLVEENEKLRHQLKMQRRASKEQTEEIDSIKKESTKQQQETRRLQEQCTLLNLQLQEYTSVYKPTYQDCQYATYDLLIIGSFGEVSDFQTLQVAQKRIPNDQEGSNQWMTKEINLTREMYELDPSCHHVSVCSDLPGTKHSKDYYLEKIRNFLTSCKQDVAVVWYTGHGERNTGNWCFKDGVITFQDIFGLYMDCYRGKRLTVQSDCSYSGNWIKDCISILDDLGIPSCGHYTKEQGILLRLFCSCGANEEATGLCYITEAHKFDEINKFIITYADKKLSSGQTTIWGDFRRIRCSKTTSEKCQIDTTCTWKEHMAQY